MIKKTIVEVLPAELLKKKEAMRKVGATGLHVLADFDKTLTKEFVRGRRVPSLISILHDYNYLTPDYPEKAKELHLKYHPIEVDIRVPLKEKKRAMLEWWRSHFRLLIESGLRRQDIEHAMTSGYVELRDGAREFFETLRKLDIPFVILSASGIGREGITAFLKDAGVLTGNVHIISNEFRWDGNDQAIGYIEPIVHTFNKDETLIRNFAPAYTAVRKRKNVILLGDSLGDLGMISGFAHDWLISIGFMNERNDEWLEEYQRHFDAILLDDAPFDYVNALLHYILSPE
ncbi:MAG: haloacid dehalogenase-like hydrolase [bacterium]|nr:haloacid dehalogenase-like hydrolase [bacterium]